MQTTPWGTTRFSFFLRNSFFRFVGFAPAAGAPAASCGSFATLRSLALKQQSRRLRVSPRGRSTFKQLGSQLRAPELLAGHHFLLCGDGALARAFPSTRVGVRPLPANRKVAAMPQSAVALDFDQPADIHLNFLAE